MMQAKEHQRELHRLRDANAYFDDEEHFAYLRQAPLCCKYSTFEELPDNVVSSQATMQLYASRFGTSR